MGVVHFGAPADLVGWMKNAFDVNVFVETGTYHGHTSSWAASQFSRVITIEGSEQYHKLARANFGHLRNITFLHGDSSQVLREALRHLDEPAMIWLDAHFCGADTFGKHAECPVLDEIQAVNDSLLDHIVLVDDARLFVAPPPTGHDPDHWPDLVELVHSLCSHGRQRYVVIVDDVLIAVPFKHKNQLRAYLRAPSHQAASRCAG